MLRFVESPSRWAWVEVDIKAIEHNVQHLCSLVAPAALWAVVKADGYGHGALPTATAAVRAGAAGLCVALVSEGLELRRAGIEAPILVLSEQPPETLDDLLDAQLMPTVYTVAGLEALSAAVRARGCGPYGFHLKLDTGMQRVGVVAPDLDGMVGYIAGLGSDLRLAAISSHLAIADDPDDPFTSIQLDRLDAMVAEILDALADSSVLDTDQLLIHTANSAAVLAHRRAHRSAVRTGIAIYGLSPGPGVAELMSGLDPALRLVARVSLVKQVRAGTAISYGLTHRFEADTTVATIPIGYADGVPRRLSAVGGEVLVHARRCPIVGVVTMDQLMIDVGDLAVEVGEEAVLIGAQGTERITAGEWAVRLDTIEYEIVSRLGQRLERLITGARA